MRVLHLGKYYPPFAGGMETFVADLIEAQRAQGLEVAALVHHEVRGWRGRWPAPGEAPPIYRAPTYGRLLYAPVAPSFPLWLGRAIRDHDPDLLHLHLPNTSAFAALLLPEARRLPWVVHWHADVVSSQLDRRLALAYRLYRPFEQRLLSQSAAIIATSPPYLEASAALAAHRARVQVIPLGLNPERMPEPDAANLAEAEACWGSGGVRVLAIGRLSYYKGHETLIRAAALRPDLQVLIVGQGEREARLAALIRRLGLEERVRLLGYRPPGLLAALLARADLLCLPSLERTEAFGMVLLEAMRFGRAVVASEIPGSGVGWVVREAGHGRLVPPGEATRLAAALEDLGRDASARALLGQRGRQALIERFAIAPVARALTDVYAKILKSTNHRWIFR